MTTTKIEEGKIPGGKKILSYLKCFFARNFSSHTFIKEKKKIQPFSVLQWLDEERKKRKQWIFYK